MAHTNLILTGWHHPDYLAAAAAVYGAQYDGDADVFGVSMAELASTLDAKGPSYRNIDVIGVGLTEGLDKLARVLKELSAQGVRTRWISRQTMPDEAKSVLEREGAAFSEVIVAEVDSLVSVVRENLDGVDAEASARFSPLTGSVPREAEAYAHPEELSVCDVWCGLFLAAGFAHRDHHDEQACGDVVKALWRAVSVKPRLPDRLRQLLDDFVCNSCRELIGKSPFATALRERLCLAARYERANVLILGETGSGKQVVAEYIHSHSDRRDKPFVHYNCAYGGSEDMLMDCLFGHEKGAFTGATDQRKGLFDAADGGTLFLDEIGEASANVQAKLLTVLETQSFTRVGGNLDMKVQVNVRLVCATNRDLQQMVLDGAFRLDLYERLCDFPVRLEPLRTHMEDLKPLVRHYWQQMTGRTPTPRQIADLMDYDYPGNVRELVSILKQANVLSDGNPGKADFKSILDAYKRFNGTLIEGLRRLRGDGGRAPAPSASVSPDPTSDDWPDNREDLLTQHAAKLYLKYNRSLKDAVDAAGVTPNTFKKYLKDAQGRGLVPPCVR